ncbi:MAG: hypothetical protein F6K28_47920 [Microcoleus sp. SIO2G3]|nr:hypothetical protein [Microcoleus sp. SIO2G3]
MALRTRGSVALDKAQRRLASIKSISENLDLGYGLTAEVYQQQIEATRAALEDHNMLVSRLDESRRTVTEQEKALNLMSARMLSAVAVKYGRDSKQYSKAGGSIARGRVASTSAQTSSASEGSEGMPTLSGQATTNGKGTASRL